MKNSKYKNKEIKIKILNKKIVQRSSRFFPPISNPVADTFFRTSLCVSSPSEGRYA
jgi:hypothetical protein